MRVSQWKRNVDREVEIMRRVEGGTIEINYKSCKYREREQSS